MKLHQFKPYLIFAIITLGFFFRIIFLSKLFYFTHDEETIAWRIMPLLRDHNLFLLGGVTPLHIHLGPWYYYLSAVILSLSKLNPLGWGIASALISILTMYLIYIIGKKYFNSRVAILALVFYASSFLMIAFDRHWWPLFPGPLLSLVTVYSLNKIIEGNLWYSLLLSLSLAFGFHTDPSTWALLILVLVAWYKFHLPIKREPILISVIIFMVSFLPLVVFDLKNQNINISGINQYLSETKPQQGLSFNRFTRTLVYIPKSLSRLLYTSSAELAANYSYCPEYSRSRVNQAPLFWWLFSVIILVYFFLKPTPKPIGKILRWYFWLIFLGLNIYGNFFASDLFDHYLTTLFPLFLLITAVSFDNLLKSNLQPLAIIFILVIICLNLNSLSKISNNFGFKDKLAAVDWAISRLKDQPFALDSLGNCFKYNGVRYLFALRSHEPDMSFVDPNFFWLYGELPKTKYPDTLVVFIELAATQSATVNPTYAQYQKHLLDRQTFGSTEVFIVNNSLHQFTIDFSQ